MCVCLCVCVSACLRVCVSASVPVSKILFVTAKNKKKKNKVEPTHLIEVVGLLGSLQRLFLPET